MAPRPTLVRAYNCSCNAAATVDPVREKAGQQDYTSKQGAKGHKAFGKL